MIYRDISILNFVRIYSIDLNIGLQQRLAYAKVQFSLKMVYSIIRESIIIVYLEIMKYITYYHNSNNITCDGIVTEISVQTCDGDDWSLTQITLMEYYFSVSRDAKQQTDISSCGIL
jgi:hypothetical protein